jgi:hypothetical protein
VAHDRTVLEESVVRELAGYVGEPVVTSFYLDVGGRRYPRPSDYAPHIDNLMRLAGERARDLGKPVADAVRADLSRVRDWLAGELGRTTTCAVAAFSCDAHGFFRVFELPVGVRDEVALGPHPEVAQLVEVLSRARRVLVAVVDEHRARLLWFDFGTIEEHDTESEGIERQADIDVELGSFERRHEEQVREHYRHVARAVERELASRTAQHLVLCGTPRAVAALEDDLPKLLRGLVIGTAHLAFTAGRAEVGRVAFDLVRQAQQRHERILVDTLRERVEQGYGAVAGLRATLDALGAGSVGTLVLTPGFSVRGGRCGLCGLLTVESSCCPRCGATPLVVEDVVGAAVSEAFANHAVVEFCESPELAALGSIGAMERS